MKLASLVFCGLFTSILLAGCENSNVIHREGQPEILKISEEDAAMNAAIAKAKKTMPTFLAAFKAPKKGQGMFSLKMPFRDGEKVEHMWITDLKFDGKKFTGILSNEPYDISNVKLGDTVIVAPSEISDWKFGDNGKLVGGTTIRVLYDAMNEADKAAFRDSFELKME